MKAERGSDPSPSASASEASASAGSSPRAIFPAFSPERARLASRLQPIRSSSTPDVLLLAQDDVTRPANSAASATARLGARGGARSGQSTPRLGPGSRSGSLPEEQALKQWSDGELIALAERMQRDLDIRTRVNHMRRYESCFRGRDAVRWLVASGAVAGVEDAVLLGNDMLRAGLLHHVKYQKLFDNKDHLYRFLDVAGGSDSDATADSQAPNNDMALDFNGFERLYDGLWARRGGDASSSASSRAVGSTRGAQPEKSVFSTAAELARLQRRVANLTAEMEEQKGMNGVMVDSLTQQLKLSQQLAALQQSRMERAIRRGSWLGLQLQLVWALLLALGAAQAQASLSRFLGAHSFAAQAAAGLVGTLAAAMVLVTLLLRPWRLPSAPAPPQEGPVHRAEEEVGMEVAVSGRNLEGEQGKLDSREQGKGTQGEGESMQQRLQRPPAAKDFEGWPDAPLLLRSAPLPYQRILNGDPARLRINDGGRIEFETELFKGCALVWAAGVPSAPTGLFEGKQRRTAITVQGRFKRAVCVDDLVTGQEFGRPPKNLPARWLVEQVLVRLAKRISPSMDIGPLSAPYLLVPLLGMAQAVSVALPGREPDPAQPFSEDMRLFDGALAEPDGSPWPAAKRKRFFWAPKNRAGRSFSPDHVFTWSIWQHFVDMEAYHLNMIYSFDLADKLDGQPLQFSVKDRGSGSGQYLYNFHAWHRRLLPAAEAACS